MGILKRKQIRIYLDDDDAKRLEKLMKHIGETVTETTTVTTLFSSALKACDEAGMMPLPLKFSLVMPTPYRSAGSHPIALNDKKK